MGLTRGKNPFDQKDEAYIDIREYGVKGDGVTDDSAAFQSAFDDAKGANGDGSGRSVFKIVIPMPDVTYRIEQTLVIDGTHGLVIEGPGWHRERRSPNNNCHFTWFGSSSLPILQIKGQTTTLSNPNFGIHISNLSFAGASSTTSAPTAPPANHALAGIYLGALAGDSNNVLNRQVVIEKCFVSDCRFGIFSGSPGGGNTDNANISINECYITNNFQHGVIFGTGNAIGVMHSCHVTNNGWYGSSYATDSYASVARGSNIYLIAGLLDLVGNVTAGLGSNKPSTADIYQESGHININTAWSDTHGYFFYQGSGTRPSHITGVRHFEGSMTTGTTPNSMRIIVPGTSVLSCEVFGNVEISSGLSGRPVFSGIRFIDASSTFTGTGVETQNSLTALGMLGNESQMWLGGGGSGKWNTVHKFTPAIAIHKQALAEVRGPAATHSGYVIGHPDASGGTFDICVNCYDVDGGFTNYKAFRVGNAIVFRFAPTGFSVRQFNFPDTTTPVSIGSFTTLGSIP